MAATCSICGHEARQAIEGGLAARSSLRDIARQHGVSKDAVARHGKNCLGPALAEQVAVAEAAGAETILQRVEHLQSRTLRLLRVAESGGELKAALMALRAARENLTLLAKLTGELDERPQINILVHPDWLGLRDRILSTLQAHPAALEAVIDAIGEPPG